MNKPLLKFIFLILMVGLGVFLFFYFNLQVYFTDKDSAIRLLNSFGPYAVPILILLQIFQVIIAPIPGEATGFLCGYLYGPVLGTVYSTIGLAIGSWIAFMLARIFGMPFVEKAINKSIIQKYDHFMEHQGIAVSFTLFLIPGFPKDALCYIIGLSRMSTATFLIISSIGRLFGTILLSVFASSVRNDQHTTLFIVAGISGVLFLLSYIYRERLLAMLKAKIK
jgi:uncharacterized membrane protein YdjX (TVP38/TMEM64 family)